MALWVLKAVKFRNFTLASWGAAGILAVTFPAGMIRLAVLCAVAGNVRRQLLLANLVIAKY